MNKADLRDYFAGKAMEGIMSRVGMSVRHSATVDGEGGDIAKLAYCMADAMLSVRDENAVPAKATREEPFQPADLSDDLLRVVSVAHDKGLITLPEVFALGMTQHDQPNWECGDEVVGLIEATLDSPWGRAHTTVEIKALRAAIEHYRQAKTEAQAESALEPIVYPGDWA